MNSSIPAVRNCIGPHSGRFWKLLHSEGFSLSVELVLHRLRCYYRPQRSCGKVIFSQVSVILSTGGCLSQCMLGYTSPWAYTPEGRTPRQTTPRQTPPGQTPLSRHPRADTPQADTPQADTPRKTPPPWADTPQAVTPPGKHPPSATATDGTHPTGMLSCLKLCIQVCIVSSHTF